MAGLTYFHFITGCPYSEFSLREIVTTMNQIVAEKDNLKFVKPATPEYWMEELMGTLSEDLHSTEKLERV